jgi:hypothetical protein
VQEELYEKAIPIFKLASKIQPDEVWTPDHIYIYIYVHTYPWSASTMSLKQYLKRPLMGI